MRPSANPHINIMTKENKKPDLHEVITNRFIEALEKGTNPWTKPWTNADSNDQFPVNISSGKMYQGINTLMLWMESNMKGYQSSKWGTFKQWHTFLKMDAKEKDHLKGEKGTPVVYWGVLYFDMQGKKLIPNKPYSISQLDAMVKQKRAKKVMYEKYSFAFNLDQISDKYKDRLPVAIQPKPAVKDEDLWHLNEGDDYTHAELNKCRDTVSAWIGDQSIRFYQGGNRACYNPSFDAITMPTKEQFDFASEYYHTFFHEIAHSTGHESRIDRFENGGSKFGDDKYALEELVAELTAAFLSNSHGIYNQTAINSEAYFKGWAEKLKADKKMIFKASKQAQKAFELITNV